jgi:hypothetical protein
VSTVFLPIDAVERSEGAAKLLHVKTGDVAVMRLYVFARRACVRRGKA